MSHQHSLQLRGLELAVGAFITDQLLGDTVHQPDKQHLLLPSLVTQEEVYNLLNSIPNFVITKGNQ